jgi:hypothetical protein
MENGSYLVGTGAAVRDELVGVCEQLGVEYLTIFPHYPGMTQRDTLDQLDRFQRDIMPVLGAEHVAELSRSV